jgi:Flp pilus assembly protein TadD
MKAKQAVVCPKCGALSRPNWEFCARCNESLEGAAPAEEQAAPTGEGGPPVSSVPAGAIALVAVVGLGLLGAAAWRYASQAPPPAQPDPNLFTVATRPSELPAPALPAGAGATDYEAGRRQMNSGDPAGAVARLAAAVAADPGNAEYHNVYAFALLRSGDRDGAIAAFAEAARLDPRQQMQYARSLDTAGRGAEAARQYEEILARNPGATTVQEDLGRLLFRTGDYKNAASHLQLAVEQRPDDPVLQQELAYSLDRAGDHARAAVAYQEVLRQAPQAVLARSLLADSLVEQGKKAEALAVLQEGLKVTPTAPLLERQIGAVLERSGRPAEAAAAYRTYAQLAPNAPDAKAMVDRAARLSALAPAPGGKP